MGAFTPPDMIIDDPEYAAAGKLAGRVVLVTGGDSGIGAATAILCAREGAEVVVNYLDEDADAQQVVRIIAGYGGTARCVKADVRSKDQCAALVASVVQESGGLDIVINNAGTQVQQKDFTAIPEAQLENTFRTNIYSLFFVTQAALPHLRAGASIINTTSVTAYRGSQELIDYSATKGAIIAFTRSLSQNLAAQSIRVNAVAPGPVWTPLVLTSFDEAKLASFGAKQPLGYAAQPIEIAPAYIYLASRDARYMTGQVLHVNGGEVVNG